MAVTAAAPPREYFYWVDLRGHLYCIDKDATTLPRQNDPAFLRDGRFLNFFWRQLQLNTPTSPGRARHGAVYPYVSPCGRELNYVRAADRPIAFHSLQTLPSGESVLLYAHDLSVPFDPAELCMRDNGRLYHPSPVGLGLLRSALASELSGCIEGDEEEEEEDRFVFGWRGRRTPIRRIVDDDHTTIDADHQ